MARRHSSEDIELNVTAMLDMAFQLLAFFVLTFRPAPLEKAVQLHIPPAQAIARVPPDVLPGNVDQLQPAGINTLRIGLFSTSGGLDRMTLNDLPAENFDVLRNNLSTMLKDPGSPIEQVVVQSSENLRYDEVMKVVEICTEQKLPKTGKLVKLSLVAMEDGAEKFDQSP
jgi:biopolymer transport protein ExbD